MLFAIDAGNTNVVFALCSGEGEIVRQWRIKTDPACTSDELTAFLAPLLDRAKVSSQEISGVIVASVVPGLDAALRALCLEMFGVEPCFVRGSDTDLGIVVDLDRPEEAGADRVVNAAAAKAFYRLPAIVVDFGTATTLDVIDGQGRYCGGVIAPGPNLSLTALAQATAKLPRITLARPDRALGRNTVDAMRAGAYWGYAAMIEGLLRRLSAELGEGKPCVIATGGLSHVIASDIPGVDETDPDLTIKGLVLLSRTKGADSR